MNEIASHHITRILCAAALFAFVASCKPATTPAVVTPTEERELQLLDAEGKTVATFRMDVEVKPSAGRESRGEIHPSTSDFKYSHFVGAHYTAKWEANRFTANLNDRVQDANLYLNGTVDSEDISGTWLLGTQSGSNPMGQFKLKKSEKK